MILTIKIRHDLEVEKEIALAEAIAVSLRGHPKIKNCDVEFADRQFSKMQYVKAGGDKK